MQDKRLANLRRDYVREGLSEANIERDPFAQFVVWMNDALNAEIIDANAMTLSTVDPRSRPTARVVLLKGYDESGFVFYTNYESKKSSDLLSNPNAALHFFWPDLERQIGISGKAVQTSREESESYFRSRPIESRLSAWASAQSSVIESRDVLENRVEKLRKQYADGNVPLPPFWGGFRVVPDKFEFWQGRASRLHDRICYELKGGDWEIYRLSP
jgi:pyridoxamine 5'-phosphate oxidase